MLVENFNDTPVQVRLVGDAALQSFTDLENGEVLPAVRAEGYRRTPQAGASFTLPPHSYRAFSYR